MGFLQPRKWDDRKRHSYFNGSLELNLFSQPWIKEKSQGLESVPKGSLHCCIFQQSSDPFSKLKHLLNSYVQEKQHVDARTH